eukprot:TRINITY_DN20372_c0_g1_i3.p1 TRINITY_DN20372_c0_g1~~TRINITY_DN20372_c0_g1_i3.p1  ORF type:complete len:241 (-),score=55.66 TRINITY_DN20372_c0_g1_i3:267-989(-)
MPMLSATAAGSSALWLSTDAAMAQPEIKVHYGDMHFWRAECIRICLFMGDVEFEDARYQGRSDPAYDAIKHRFTFGAVPVMEVDGRILSQTQAMAGYAARLAGSMPHDPWDAAKVDEAINGCTDCTTDIAGTFRIHDQAAKIAAREALVASDGRLTKHLAGLETLISENGSKGVVAGDKMTVADIAIWRMVGWLSSGVIDGIPKTYVASNFPQIADVCAKVDADPKVMAWKAAHPKQYPR